MTILLKDGNIENKKLIEMFEIAISSKPNIQQKVENLKFLDKIEQLETQLKKSNLNGIMSKMAI
jgi:hypothetical protein